MFETLFNIVLLGGTALASVAFIFARANARVECGRMIDDRIARYAGVNREI